MSKEREQAHEIIGEIEDAIRKANPTVDKIAEKNEGNVLLYGKDYYSIESYLVRILKKVNSNG